MLTVICDGSNNWYFSLLDNGDTIVVLISILIKNYSFKKVNTIIKGSDGIKKYIYVFYAANNA